MAIVLKQTGSTKKLCSNQTGGTNQTFLLKTSRTNQTVIQQTYTTQTAITDKEEGEFEGMWSKYRITITNIIEGSSDALNICSN